MEGAINLGHIEEVQRGHTEGSQRLCTTRQGGYGHVGTRPGASRPSGARGGRKKGEKAMQATVTVAKYRGKKTLHTGTILHYQKAECIPEARWGYCLLRRRYCGRQTG